MIGSKIHATLPFIRLAGIVVSFSLIFALVDIGFSHQPVLGVQAIGVQGEGFGNNGERFASFVDCGDGKKEFYNGGSHLKFSSTISDHSVDDEENNNMSGEWKIEFRTSGTSEFQYKSGSFSIGKISNNIFTLSGVETKDDVCRAAPSNMTITGYCNDSAPIYYDASNGQKIGSTVPNSEEPIYYLFGSQIHCS
jgi:hypothetical protein